MPRFTGFTTNMGDDVQLSEFNVSGATKGDLISFTTAWARLPIGTNGQTLIADSGEATGLKWSNLNDLITTIDSGTISGDFSITSIPSGFKLLILVYEIRTTGGTIGGGLQLNEDAGASAYKYGNTTDTVFLLNTGAFDVIKGTILITQPATDQDRGITSISHREDSGTGSSLVHSGYWDNSADEITRIDILKDSGAGTIGDGDFVLYGVKV